MSIDNGFVGDIFMHQGGPANERVSVASVKLADAALDMAEEGASKIP